MSVTVITLWVSVSTLVNQSYSVSIPLSVCWTKLLRVHSPVCLWRLWQWQNTTRAIIIWIEMWRLWQWRNITFAVIIWIEMWRLWQWRNITFWTFPVYTKLVYGTDVYKTSWQYRCTLNKFKVSNLGYHASVCKTIFEYRCTQNQFRQMYIESVLSAGVHQTSYKTGVHKTSLGYRCTTVTVHSLVL